MQLDSFVRDIVLMAEPAGPRVPGGNAFMSCALQIFSFFNSAGPGWRPKPFFCTQLIGRQPRQQNCREEPAPAEL